MKPRNVSKKYMAKVHPRIPEYFDMMNDGRLTRREFMRFATLLGMSAGVASVAAACGGAEAPAATDEVMDEGSMDEGGAKAGGTLLIGMETSAILDHPARLSWIQGANIVRQVAEYLAEPGADNIVRPWLLESWEANEDVNEWTLNIRQGIKFNNGDELTADDVLFNFDQWLDDEVGSSVKGLLNYLEGGMNDLERVDDYTIKMHLSAGNIGVPVHLTHYPAAIMHRDFQGDFVASPVGTGPFTMTEYNPDQAVVMTRRDDYWGGPAGPDSGFPYLDGIRYINMDKDAALNALSAGEIHTFYQPRPTDWEAMKDNADINVVATSTAQTLILRHRVDIEPFNDLRLIKALRLCQDRQQILNLAWFGEGDQGVDAHIAPVHPAYDEREIPAQDIEGAKALLEEWAAETGNSLPLAVTLVTKNDEGEQQYAEVLQQAANEAGFDMSLDITEASGYWERWDEVPLGITSWTHRPLGTMVLELAYIADNEGNPVAWNETRWVDEEFSDTLVAAASTLDVDARRVHMGKLMDIFWERGPIGVAFFKSAWRLARHEVKNITAHPTQYDLMYNVWLDDAA